MWFAFAGALVIGVIAFALLRRQDVGQGRFFADQSYHFQALNDVPSDGADTAEVLETIKRVRSGDAQGWFRAWSNTGERVARSAAATTDRIAKGRALLRAHNYYRTTEFFLPPDDAKRPVSAAKNIQSFYKGLDALGVTYRQIHVPYGEGHHLEAVHYLAAEGAPQRPLIVLGGGFDSTIEELYFVLVKDAHERGYAVLTYDGPGQGSVLRDQAPRQPFSAPSRAREARGADSRSRFHFLGSAARTAPAMPRLAALAADGAGGGAQSRPSYAVAAEGRPRLRSAVGVRVNHFRQPHARARRRFQIAVSFFRFSSADRAGDAEVGGAGRRWCRRRSSIAAELRGGCRRPPAPPLRRRGRVDHDGCGHARARRRRFQRALTPTDLHRPAQRRCGCWPPSTVLFSGIVVGRFGGGRWSSGDRRRC